MAMVLHRSASFLDQENKALRRRGHERLRKVDEKADELLGKAATIVEQEVQRATKRKNFYVRWRDTLAALKREGIVDQACALLCERMDWRGDDSLDWLLLQALDPEGYSKRSSDWKARRAKAIRLEIRARLAGVKIGRKRLAKETGASEATIQAWRNQPDYWRDIKRAMEFHRPREELRRRVEQMRERRNRRGDGGRTVP